MNTLVSDIDLLYLWVEGSVCTFTTLVMDNSAFILSGGPPKEKHMAKVPWCCFTLSDHDNTWKTLSCLAFNIILKKKNDRTLFCREKESKAFSYLDQWGTTGVSSLNENQAGMWLSHLHLAGTQTTEVAPSCSGGNWVGAEKQSYQLNL